MDNAKANILIAEDNPALAAVIEFNLRRAGFSVTRTKNGRVAWEAACREEFDLVVTDHQMPEMTGVELCQKLRESPRYIETPIIMLTAKGLELDLDHLRKTLDISAAISKPFSPAALVRKVEGYLVESCAAAV